VVVIRFRPNARLDPLRLVKVVGQFPGAILVPPVSIKLDLDVSAAPTRTEVAPKRSERSSRRADATSTSWWTARATAGDVRPGFSKDEILRKPEGDPRAEGGMFARVGGLLRALDPDGQSF
jgi:hypothetical protein